MWKQFMQDKVFTDPYQHRFFNKGGLRDLFSVSGQDYTTENMVDTADANLVTGVERTPVKLHPYC